MLIGRRRFCSLLSHNLGGVAVSSREHLLDYSVCVYERTTKPDTYARLVAHKLIETDSTQ